MNFTDDGPGFSSLESPQQSDEITQSPQSWSPPLGSVADINAQQAQYDQQQKYDHNGYIDQYIYSSHQQVRLFFPFFIQ